jgi:hypothetical protein
VSEGIVDYRNRLGFCEYRERMPITEIQPYPMTVAEQRQWKSVFTLGAVPTIIALVLHLVFADHAITVLGMFAALGYCSYGCLPWVIGSTEWTSFNTNLKDKTIFFFHSPNDSVARSFVDALNDAIVRSRDSTN